MEKDEESPKVPLLLPEHTHTYLLFHQSKKVRHRFYLGLVAIVAIFSLIFGLLSAWLDEHSLTKVQMAGITVTHDTQVPELEKQIDSVSAGYKLKIIDAGGQAQSYSLNDLGLKIDRAGSAGRAKIIQAAGGTLDHAKWWRKTQLPLVMQVNSQVLDSFINTKISKTLKPVQNAALAVEGGQAKLTPESRGSEYNIKDAKKAIISAGANLSTAPLTASLRYIDPAIQAKDLEAKKQQVDKVLGQQISFTINGHQVVAGAADIGNWLELTPVESAKTVDLTINSGKILEYLNQIARPYTQPPKSQLVLTATDGSKQVLVPGQNGVDIVDKEDVAKNVAASVLSAKGVAMDLPIKYQTFSTVPAQDWDKFLVIDTTTKRMYAYEHTVLANSFLVSAGAPATPTVLGQYKIYAKYEKQDMRGENVDGSRYFQPDVQWINYFYKDYAVHGNYWRPLSYFGRVNSSHGCVGVVNDDAKWVYDWAPVGTPVLVHD